MLDRRARPHSNSTAWSSLLDSVSSLPSRVLYLVHQPGDLVHLHQSLLLSRALVQQGILFKQQASGGRGGRQMYLLTCGLRPFFE